MKTIASFTAYDSGRKIAKAHQPVADHEHGHGAAVDVERRGEHRHRQRHRVEQPADQLGPPRAALRRQRVDHEPDPGDDQHEVDEGERVGGVHRQQRGDERQRRPVDERGDRTEEDAALALERLVRLHLVERVVDAAAVLDHRQVADDVDVQVLEVLPVVGGVRVVLVGCEEVGAGHVGPGEAQPADDGGEQHQTGDRPEAEPVRGGVRRRRRARGRHPLLLRIHHRPHTPARPGRRVDGPPPGGRCPAPMSTIPIRGAAAEGRGQRPTSVEPTTPGG
jgi:hypothetical protein